MELESYEDREDLEDFLNDYLWGKKIDFGIKKGEHIEERPVYVVTADGMPFAVVRRNFSAIIGMCGSSSSFGCVGFMADLEGKIKLNINLPDSRNL